MRASGNFGRWPSVNLGFAQWEYRPRAEWEGMNFARMDLGYAQWEFRPMAECEGGNSRVARVGIWASPSGNIGQGPSRKVKFRELHEYEFGLRAVGISADGRVLRWEFARCASGNLGFAQWEYRPRAE